MRTSLRHRRGRKSLLQRGVQVPLPSIQKFRLRDADLVLGSLYCLYCLYMLVAAIQMLPFQHVPEPPPDTLTRPFPRLDFMVAGFPKCGTTSLLYSLTAHPEVSIDRREHCTVAIGNKLAEGFIRQKFRRDLAELSDSSISNAARHKMMGIKCPSLLSNDHALSRLTSWQQDDLGLVIGLRHPVWQIQSYYNYRVTELYDKKVWWKYIRRLPDILEGRTKPWKGMSPYSYRYELFLQQLNKVNLTTSEVEELQQYPELSVQTNQFRIFVYALEQLEDENKERNEVFRRDLSNFLHLQQPLSEIGHENQNHFTGAAAHPETIDICDASFEHVRQHIVRDAAVAARWIGERFIDATDVSVSNRDHFLAALEGWKTDPCLARKRIQ